MVDAPGLELFLYDFTRKQNGASLYRQESACVSVTDVDDFIYFLWNTNVQ